MMRIIFIFCCLLFGLQARDLSWQQTLKGLTNQEQLYLEKFFRTMLINSEGGYVLLGSKPVCEEGILDVFYYSNYPGFFPERSVVLYEGYKIWQKYFSSFPTNLIICKTKHGEAGWKFFLSWINKKKILEVVQNNLSLFRYLLGPKLTPGNFLENFIKPEMPPLKDQTLIGILLGFGTQNSIIGKRHEDIYYLSSQKEELPLLPRRLRSPIFTPFLYESEIMPYSSISPSFSFSSLEEELKTYNENSIQSTSFIKYTYPCIPIFGVFDKEEAEPILKNLASDQRILRDLLQKDNFLEAMLQRIFEE